MTVVIALDGHAREEELADYVADALALEEALRLEAHVLECTMCARRLQRAASLQMVLHEAAALEAEIVEPQPSGPSWLRRRMGAVSALWASAAAVLLLVCQQGGSGALELEDDAAAPTAVVATIGESREAEPSVTRCDPADPRCADGLLASVDPLQSVDPLSSWPDEPSLAAGSMSDAFGVRGPFFASGGWADEATFEGEPCGSGEDGGPLVCQRSI